MMRSLDKALLKGVVGGSVFKPNRPHSAKICTPENTTLPKQNP
ncbi:hypothetical protein [Pseudoalteromonas luteoviolacea]|nr:hypothetical protein [Pseudoalteromonas luteoviolacea]